MTGPSFHTTRWSLVVRAAGPDPASRTKALGELCEAYWYPLYVYLRRAGHAEADALDLVQSFCAQVLEHGGLGGASAPAGSFRHYLLGALRHFVDNQARRQRAERRGGGTTTWSFDAAEARYAGEPAHQSSPERLFERRWAEALLARASSRLREEYAARNRSALLTALEPALLGGDTAVRHAAVAALLGTTEGAVKVALHRLRARMRELVRDEVAQTLTDPLAVDDELAQLFAALSG